MIPGNRACFFTYHINRTSRHFGGALGPFDGLARNQQRHGVQPAGIVSPPSLRWAETTADLVPLTPSR